MSEYVGKIKDLPEAPGNFIENASKKVVFGPLHFWPDYVMDRIGRPEAVNRCLNNQHLFQGQHLHMSFYSEALQ